MQYAKPPLVLERHYVGRIIKKIHAERLTRHNTADMNRRIAEMQDRTETVVGQMWKILLNAGNPAKERVMAGKVILDADKNLLDAQMDAGVFDRKLGTVALDHQHEHFVRLPDEVRLPILRAFKNYGFVKSQPVTNTSEPAAANAIVAV